MIILPFSSEAIAQAADIIRAGGVVAHATETCYGLACDLANADAVALLFRIKDRPVTQPVSGLFRDLEQAKEYAEWNDEAQRLARQFLPGPLTVVLPLRPDAPLQLFPTASSERSMSIGVRVSSHPHARALSEAVGTPLSTTSANRHGRPNPYSAEEVMESLRKDSALAMIIDGGPLPPVPPSTVMDLTNEEATIIRKGNVAS